MKPKHAIRRIAMSLIRRYDAALSGPISADPGYRDKFNALESRIRAANPGWRVFNPARLPPGRPFAWYMARCCRAICRTRRLYTLPGWHTSPGAKAETYLAKSIRLVYIIHTNHEVTP